MPIVKKKGEESSTSNPTASSAAITPPVVLEERRQQLRNQLSKEDDTPSGSSAACPIESPSSPKRPKLMTSTKRHGPTKDLAALLEYLNGTVRQDIVEGEFCNYEHKQEADERQFEELLQKHYGYEIYRVAGDGNCMFRAVADQIYGDDSMHAEIRSLCMNYIEQEKDYFLQFVTGESIDDYIIRKRRLGTYGNHLELQAISELYNRPIEIFAYNKVTCRAEPLNLFQTDYDKNNPPIRLSYHNNNHYNSVRDPKNPTFGCGLGLPGIERGLASKEQVQKALCEAEDRSLDEHILAHMEQESLNEQLIAAEARESELDFAQRQLEEAILQESMKEFVQDECEDAITRCVMEESIQEYIKSLSTEKD